MTAKTISPSPKQREIIGHGGDTIVVSNPGTGKTTTLSLKVAQLLREGADPDGILCITFTKKARREMYDAIYAQGIDEFPEQVKKVHIHTFHSFAYEYLTDSGQIPDDIIDENYLRFSIFNSLTEAGALHYDKDYIISSIVPGAANTVNYIKSFGILPGDIDVKRVSEILDDKNVGRKSTYTIEEVKAFLGYFADAYDSYEKSKGIGADYTDVLLRFLERFKGPVFEHVLIDEMQDMNQMQAEIARRVADSIFLVGDTKQAIFGFQGGSTRHFETFEDRCTKMLLSENRRSTNQILDYAKGHYLDHITDDRGKVAADLEEFRSERNGERPVVISVEECPLPSVLKVIRENPSKSIGIITRTNTQAVEVSEYLYDKGIRHATTTSQATTQRAKIHVMDFLAGLLYDDRGRRLRAALTVFSPYTLKEALGLTGAFGRGADGAQKWPVRLDSLGSGLTAAGMDELFGRVILPMCVARGPEWFFTAKSVKEDIDGYLRMDNPTLDGLFDYMAICEEPATERVSRRSRGDEDASSEEGVRDGGGNESRDAGDGASATITVSTIHKAKGQEFDVVAYMPKDTKMTSFLDGIKAAILESRDIDAEELEQEQARLHFVAFTRARDKLAIIVDGKSANDFHMEGLCDMVEAEDEGDGDEGGEADGHDSRLQEAYRLFVSGRTGDAEELLGGEEHDGWLDELIAAYFEGMERVSYSSIRTKPSEFLARNIINMPSTSASAEFGRRVHEAMHHMLMGGGEKEKDSGPPADGREKSEGDGSGRLQKAVRNGMQAIDVLKSQYPGLRVHALEKKMEVPVREMTACEGHDDVVFAGKIDVIFRHDSGYLIIDYKTGKNTKRSAEAHRQLAAYKRMLSRAEGIPEDSIDARAVFVTLTGSINTGRFDMDITKPRDNAYQTFEKHLQKVLKWKQDVPGFVDELLNEKRGGYGSRDDEISNMVIERLAAHHHYNHKHGRD